jgi:hypothetical protein
LPGLNAGARLIFVNGRPSEVLVVKWSPTARLALSEVPCKKRQYEGGGAVGLKYTRANTYKRLCFSAKSAV